VLSVPGRHNGFSPNGALLATTRYEDTPHLWRTADGTAISINAPRWFRGFSPDGALLVVGTDGTTLWDIAADREVLSVEGTFDAFSPDGAHLVTSGSDAWYLWDVDTGERLALLNWGESHRWWLDFSPDGSWLAWSSFDNVVRVWDLHANTEAATLFEEATVARFTPDGALLITRHDNVVYSWSTATWSLLDAFPVGDGRHLALSKDGSTLIATETCRSYRDTCPVNLFRLAGTELIQRGSLPTTRASDVELVLSPDGHYLFRANQSRVELWDLTTRALLPLPFENEITVDEAFCSPDGTLLFVQVRAGRGQPQRGSLKRIGKHAERGHSCPGIAPIQ